MMIAASAPLLLLQFLTFCYCLESTTAVATTSSTTATAPTIIHALPGTDTLQLAVAKRRALGRNLSSDVIIELASGGLYTLTEPLVISPADGGGGQHWLRFATETATSSAAATISGGVAIPSASWSQQQQQPTASAVPITVWSAPLP